jgi:branched-chain amino acid transport system substrate-binding protein
MRSFGRVPALAVAMAAMLAALACGGSSSSSGGNASNSGPPLKIGVINPYSGAVAIYGEELYRGNSIAVDEINAKGGVNGRKIELVKGDAASPDQGIQEATRLATQQNVDAFTGTYLSAVSKTASETAARYKKLYWDTNSVASELTERGLANFVRSGPYATSFASVSVDTVTGLVTKHLGKPAGQSKVWLEHEDSIYGTSIADIQKTSLTSKGYQVVGNSGHPASSTDLTDSVLRAQRATPDVVVFTGYVPDANLFLRTARDHNFSPVMLLVGTGDTKETLQALGAESIEGMLVVGYPRPDINPSFGPGAQQYLDAYRKKFSAEPVAPQGMSAYVGMKMLADAIGKAGGTDPAKVKKSIQGIDKPVGSFANGFGEKFDDKYQNTRAFPLAIQWQSGKQVTVFPEKAAQPSTKVVPLKRAGA